MKPLTTDQEIEAVGAAAAAIGSAVLFWTNLGRILVRRCRQALNAIDPFAFRREILNSHKEILSTHKTILAELRPNGGDSLRDTVNKIDGKVTAIGDKQESIELRQRQTAAQVTLLLEGSQTLGWISDTNGKQTWASAALVEKTGWDASELLGWGWINIIYGPDQERITRTWQAALVQNRIFDEDCLFQMRDRRLFEGHLNARPFPNHGQPMCYIGTIVLLRELKRQPMRKRAPSTRKLIESLERQSDGSK